MLSAEFIINEGRRVAKLCKGHTDIAKYQAALSKEYGEAFTIERKWQKKLPYFMAPKDAATLIGRLVQAFKIRKVKQIVMNSREAKGLGGVYDSGTIHLPGEHIFLLVLLHEFTHHLCLCEKKGVGHGKIFCEFLEIVCEEAHGHFKNKKFVR